MRVLVVNAGSSSLKLRVLDHADRVVASHDIPAPGGVFDPGALEAFLERVTFDAAGHRVVHGGHEFHESVIVTENVMEAIRRVAELAPLHNPPAITALETVRDLGGEYPSVACFDTAFHADLPEEAAVYAVPWSWTEGWKIRRFGFHGLSHSYVSRRAGELVGKPVGELRIVSCHLGAGASLAAVAHGRSVDTTMGFTPLEGLVMATRCGSLDPGILLWVQRQKGLGAGEVERVLEHESGLLGISGVDASVSLVLGAAEKGDRRARLAVDVYLHRLRGSIAAMAAAMGGVDVIVFTGAVGEAVPLIRRETCRGLAFLGVTIEDDRNERGGTEDRELSPEGASVRVAVIQAREDLEISADVRRLLR